MNQTTVLCAKSGQNGPKTGLNIPKRKNIVQSAKRGYHMTTLPSFLIIYFGPYRIDNFCFWLSEAQRPPGGALAARALPSPAPEPQRKSRQQNLFSFFRRASHERRSDGWRVRVACMMHVSFGVAAVALRRGAVVGGASRKHRGCADNKKTAA